MQIDLTKITAESLRYLGVAEEQIISIVDLYYGMPFKNIDKIKGSDYLVEELKRISKFEEVGNITKVGDAVIVHDEVGRIQHVKTDRFFRKHFWLEEDKELIITDGDVIFTDNYKDGKLVKRTYTSGAFLTIEYKGDKVIKTVYVTEFGHKMTVEAIFKDNKLVMEKYNNVPFYEYHYKDEELSYIIDKSRDKEYKKYIFNLNKLWKICDENEKTIVEIPVEAW